MHALHMNLGWGAIAVSILVGIWGIALSWRRRDPSIGFWWGVGAASTLLLLQVGLGVVLSEGPNDSGDQHVFYGIVIVFVLAFTYIYRSQMRRRPSLYYGLLFLFLAGLGLRAIATLGLDF